MAIVYSLSLLLLSTLLSEYAVATTDIAVYFDDGSYKNPFGSDYVLKRPQQWDQVDIGTWPIFLDWGKNLKDASRWDKGNQCSDRSSSNYDVEHRQSPIKLTRDSECTDRHKMTTINKGVCSQNQPRFYSTPYGLAVDVTPCTKAAVMDHSYNDDPWTLKEIVLKSPAEHSMLISGAEQKFDAELQLNFAGSNSGWNSADSHSDRISTTSVLLKQQSGESDPELELLLKGWELAMNGAYAACKKTYNHNTCSLQSVRLRRDLEKNALPLEEDCEEDLDRNLATYNEFNQQCPNSAYCFINLYLHTKTHYYYNYFGSLTYPPCTEKVHYRVMQGTIKISPGQLLRIQKLTYMHLNKNCELGTAGVRISGCTVGVNRPTQALSKKHGLKKCDQWTPSSFDNTTALNQNTDDDVTSYLASTNTSASSNDLF